MGENYHVVYKVWVTAVVKAEDLTEAEYIVQEAIDQQVQKIGDRDITRIKTEIILDEIEGE